MMLLRITIIVVTWLPAIAGAANPSFEAAKKAWDNYEIDRVLPLLEEAMSVSTDLVEKTQILELKARLHISQDQTDEARAAFVELLGLAPNYKVPEGSSPKIREVFEAAHASMATTTPPPPPPDDPDDEVDMDPVPPVPGAKSPVWETWWFWTIVGGVVVAGGTALTVALVSGGPPESDLFFEMR